MGMEDARVVGISKSNELAVLLHVGALDRQPVTLARMPLSGGAPREVLENVRDAAWSPDEQLAVVLHAANGRDQLEYPIGKVLYQTAGWISNPRFSPDGKRIAFLDHVAFPDAAGTVSVVDLNGKREVLTRKWGDLRGLAWSPSGNEIWYGGADANWDALRVVDLAHHDRLLLELPSVIELKDISADGRALIDSRNNRLPIMGRTAGMERERDLSWLDVTVLGDISPDGKQILLCEEDSPGANADAYWVGTRALAGSPVVRLGNGVGGRFSADGKWVTSLSLAKPPKVSVIPLAVGQAKDVPLPGIDRLVGTNVGFFPDAKQIWFIASYRAGGVNRFAVDIGGGTPAPITPERRAGRWNFRRRAKHDRETMRRGFVTLFPIGGGQRRGASCRAVAAKEKFIQWGADGHSIYVRDFGLPTTIYQVNLTSGQRTAVLKLMPADPAGVVTVFDVAMTRDAKSYAYGFSAAASPSFWW